MNLNNITPVSSLILHFYARCFSFPYEEMIYEIQHIFRRIESEILTEEDELYAEQILSILNAYQGEDIQDLRIEYVSLFTSHQGPHPRCPIIASDFMRLTMQNYDPSDAEELILDSGIPVNMDEPLDSVINYLQYLSYALQEFYFDQSSVDEITLFYKDHILSWIPHLCDILYKAAGISFYKEFAAALKEYILSFDSEY